MAIPRPGTEEWRALERTAAAGDAAARERLSVARLISRHALSERDAVARDAEPYRDMAPEEKWRHVVAAGRLAARWLAAMSEADRARVMDAREPPHPSYFVHLARWRAAARRETSPPT